MEAIRPTTLWVVPVSNLAGVARHVIDACRVGVPGWRVIVAAPEGPLLEVLREQGQAVLVADIGPDVATLKAVRELRAVVKSVRPAIVHSHLARADILAALATVGLPTRLVSTEHHVPEDRLTFHDSLLKARVMETVHHLRCRRFSALLACSASTKRDMERWWKPTRAVQVVRNGVDRPSPPVHREPGLRYLSLARLSAEKNIAMTLRVFARVAAEHPEARLTVAGLGPDEDALRGLAAELGVADHVDFPGFVDPVEAMASHDAILQPSRADNLSYTLLDAVAQGMGVAASPIGGNPEILPARCMAPLDDDAAFARVAVTQGLDVAARPVLPEAIPTVAQMTEQIARAYAGVLR